MRDNPRAFIGDLLVSVSDNFEDETTIRDKNGHFDYKDLYTFVQPITWHKTNGNKFDVNTEY